MVFIYRWYVALVVYRLLFARCVFAKSDIHVLVDCGVFSFAARLFLDMSGVIRGPAGSNDCRIYVGNLPPDIRTKDVEDVFYKYGAIRDIDLKNRRGGPPFAFVEFEDPR